MDSTELTQNKAYSQFPWIEIFGDKTSLVPQYINMLHHVIENEKMKA